MPKITPRAGRGCRMTGNDMSNRRARNLSAIFALLFGSAMLSSVYFFYGYSGRGEFGIVQGAVEVGFTRSTFGWIAGASSNRLRNLYWMPHVYWDQGARVIVIPLWIPTILAAVASVYFHRKARTAPPGQCRYCRYDLTGNESGVCPECGTPMTVRAEQRKVSDLT